MKSTLILNPGLYSRRVKGQGRLEPVDNTLWSRSKSEAAISRLVYLDGQDPKNPKKFAKEVVASGHSQILAPLWSSTKLEQGQNRPAGLKDDISLLSNYPLSHILFDLGTRILNSEINTGTENWGAQDEKKQSLLKLLQVLPSLGD